MVGSGLPATMSHCSDYSTEFRRRRRGEPKRSPPELVNVGMVVLNIEQHRNGNTPVESCWRTGILRAAIKGSHHTDRNIPVRQRPSSGFTLVQGQLWLSVYRTHLVYSGLSLTISVASLM